MDVSEMALPWWIRNKTSDTALQHVDNNSKLLRNVPATPYFDSIDHHLLKTPFSVLQGGPRGPPGT